MKMILQAAVLALCCVPAMGQSAPASAAGGSQSSAPQNSVPAATTGLQAADATKPQAIDPKKEASIRRLMEVSGAERNMQQAMSGMLTAMRPVMTNSMPPGEYRDTLVGLFMEKFQSKANVKELLDQMVPIYDQFYTTEEIEQLTQFYLTPLGKKYLSIAPQLIAASQKIGMAWGQQAGKAAMMEVLDTHPELKKAMTDAAAAPRN